MFKSKYLSLVLAAFCLACDLPALCLDRPPNAWERIFEEKFEKEFLLHYKPTHWMQDKHKCRVDVKIERGNIARWKIVDYGLNEKFENALNDSFKYIKNHPDLAMAPVDETKKKTMILRRMFTSSEDIMLFDTKLYRCTIRDAEEVPIDWKIGTDTGFSNSKNESKKKDQYLCDVSVYPKEFKWSGHKVEIIDCWLDITRQRTPNIVFTVKMDGSIHLPARLEEHKKLEMGLKELDLKDNITKTGSKYVLRNATALFSYGTHIQLPEDSYHVRTMYFVAFSELPRQNVKLKVTKKLHPGSKDIEEEDTDVILEFCLNYEK